MSSVARGDLPGLLALHPDHPDRGPIDRWVASLTDVEVLDRMARFRTGNTVEDMQRTIRVVDAMLDEVRSLDAKSTAISHVLAPPLRTPARGGDNIAPLGYWRTPR